MASQARIEESRRCSLNYYYRNKEQVLEKKRQRAKLPEVRAKQKLYQERYTQSGRPEELRKMREFGLAEGEYESMLKKQNGQCAICDTKMNRPHIDHCHSTGKVRGLLCVNCNKGIGHLKDNIDILLSALSYLQRSK